MNILDEITIKNKLDSKILCDTPAKLKLRDKTLKGIHFNLNDEKSPLPALMLAKQTNNEVNGEQDINATILDGEKLAGDDTISLTKKLNIAGVNKDILEKRGRELVQTIKEAADIKLEETPAVAGINIEEIPEVVNEEVKTEPIVPIVEELQYNVEQGEEGKVAKVEPTKVPTIEEVREKIIPSVPKQQMGEGNGLDKANTDEGYQQLLELNQEIVELKQQTQKKKELFEKCKDEFQEEVNIGNELDKAYGELKQAYDEAKNRYTPILNEQKNSEIERHNVYDQGIQEFTNKAVVQKEENASKLERYRQLEENFAQFQQMMNQQVPTAENVENYQEEERSYGRVA